MTDFADARLIIIPRHSALLQPERISVIPILQLPYDGNRDSLLNALSKPSIPFYSMFNGARVLGILAAGLFNGGGGNATVQKGEQAGLLYAKERIYLGDREKISHRLKVRSSYTHC